MEKKTLNGKVKSKWVEFSTISSYIKAPYMRIVLLKDWFLAVALWHPCMWAGVYLCLSSGYLHYMMRFAVQIAGRPWYIDRLKTQHSPRTPARGSPWWRPPCSRWSSPQRCPPRGAGTRSGTGAPLHARHYEFLNRGVTVSEASRWRIFQQGVTKPLLIFENSLIGSSTTRKCLLYVSTSPYNSRIWLLHEFLFI